MNTNKTLQQSLSSPKSLLMKSPRHVKLLGSKSNSSSSSSSQASDEKYQEELIKDKIQMILTPIKTLKKGENPIFISKDSDSSQFYVIKFFPYNGDQRSNLFTNSLHSKGLTHPNIIAVQDYFKKVSGRFINVLNQSYSVLALEVAPYGDFQSLLLQNKIPPQDNLIRTYFHQLINALEYMHLQGVAHLDLNLENILMGNDYNLKISDFETAYWLNQQHTNQIARRGTMNFRAPEIKEGKFMSPQASDIYSAGIILFALKTGMLPYHEDHNDKMYYAMSNNPSAFWESQEENVVSCDDDFKELFISMIRPIPTKRATIREIKSSRWFNGPVYQPNELVSFMKNYKLLKILPQSKSFLFL